MTHDLLKGMTLALSDYLSARLPKCGANWWHERVRLYMPPDQRGSLDRRGVERLDGLDLAALLRVMDKNWRDLAVMDELSSQDLNFLKEMIAVRNRWAHQSAAPVSDEDTYRDLDTLDRFLRVIGGSAELAKAIQTAKKQTISRMADSPSTSNRRLVPAGTKTSAVIPATATTTELVAMVTGVSIEPTRTWTGNDITARNHHGPVSLKETPLVLDLRWRRSAQHQPVAVGVFKLDLPGLLKAGYVRPEKTPGAVRLRFWHGEDDMIYIQVNSSSKKLAVAAAKLARSS